MTHISKPPGGARPPEGPRGSAAPLARPEAPWRGLLGGLPIAGAKSVPSFGALLKATGSTPSVFRRRLEAMGLSAALHERSHETTVTGTCGPAVDVSAAYALNGQVQSLRLHARADGGFERHTAVKREGMWHLASYEASLTRPDAFAHGPSAPWPDQLSGQPSRSGSPIPPFTDGVAHAGSPSEFRAYLESLGHVAASSETPSGDLHVQGAGWSALFSRAGAPIRVTRHVMTARGSEQHRGEAQLGGVFRLAAYEARYEDPAAQAWLGDG